MKLPRRMGMSRQLLNHRRVPSPAIAPTPQEQALAYVAQQDRALAAQIEDIDRAMQALVDQRMDCTQQRRWLAEQRDQLVTEAAARP